MKNSIRIGHVSSIDAAKGTVKVVMDDQQDIVTDDLPLLAFEYFMPEVGDLVLCIFLGNGISKGFCLSKYFSEVTPAPVSDAKIYYKDLFGEAFIKYDRNNKTMTLQADKIVIQGEITINGNVAINGTLATTGDISTNGDITADGDIAADGNITATGTIHGSNL